MFGSILGYILECNLGKTHGGIPKETSGTPLDKDKVKEEREQLQKDLCKKLRKSLKEELWKEYESGNNFGIIS